MDDPQAVATFKSLMEDKNLDLYLRQLSLVLAKMPITPDPKDSKGQAELIRSLIKRALELEETQGE